MFLSDSPPRTTGLSFLGSFLLWLWWKPEIFQCALIIRYLPDEKQHWVKTVNTRLNALYKANMDEDTMRDSRFIRRRVSALDEKV